ncbi:uncharacterized protein EI97DRAFT_83477 [Westerdykella ornata]|uniref:Uncharacterized protein n=1 Tax=Westerdykella ornata TaxID=318751 RepID=A0A6A6JED3_WESOR|nr:uncharacterized protein EI97DRAFT_83477 [Westerdykella ornata]KAF2274970.1 hypothetical protein EI97DRAFT_83477 [Westerdykella ornata]
MGKCTPCTCRLQPRNFFELDLMDLTCLVFRPTGFLVFSFFLPLWSFLSFSFLPFPLSSFLLLSYPPPSFFLLPPSPFFFAVLLHLFTLLLFSLLLLFHFILVPSLASRTSLLFLLFLLYQAPSSATYIFLGNCNILSLPFFPHGPAQATPNLHPAEITTTLDHATSRQESCT